MKRSSQQAMWAKYNNLSKSTKKELLVDAGMKPEHVTDFSTSLPASQMNPFLRRKIMMHMKKNNE